MSLSNFSFFSPSLTLSPFLTHQEEMIIFPAFYLFISISLSLPFPLSLSLWLRACVCVRVCVCVCVTFSENILTFHSFTRTHSLSLSHTHARFLQHRKDVSDAIRVLCSTRHNKLFFSTLFLLHQYQCYRKMRFNPMWKLSSSW